MRRLRREGLRRRPWTRWTGRGMLGSLPRGCVRELVRRGKTHGGYEFAVAVQVGILPLHVWRSAAASKTYFDESHAAEIKHIVITIEKTIGRIKRYRQLTTVIAAKERANAHAVPRMRVSISAGRPPSCQASIAVNR